VRGGACLRGSLTLYLNPFFHIPHHHHHHNHHHHHHPLEIAKPFREDIKRTIDSSGVKPKLVGFLANDDPGAKVTTPA
jgi:hypothetical protein